MGTTFTAFVQQVNYTAGIGEWYGDVAVVDLGKSYDFVRELENREVTKGIPLHAGFYVWQHQKRFCDTDECWFSCSGSLVLEVLKDMEKDEDSRISIYVRVLGAILREMLPHHPVRLIFHICG